MYQVLIPKYYMSFFFSHTLMRDSEFGGDVHTIVQYSTPQYWYARNRANRSRLRLQCRRSRRFAKNSVPCRINIGSCTLDTLWVYHRYDSP